MTFYLTVMESYFIGGITLDPINAPNEGNFTIAAMGIVSYLFGF